MTYHQRGLAIREEALGPDHSNVANSLYLIGNTLIDQGKLEDAASHHRRALAIQEKALGPRHAEVAKPSMGLARIALEEHDAATAREHAERAVSILEASEVAPELLNRAHFLLARALWPDPSQRPRARVLGEQVRATYAALGEAKRAELAEVETWLIDRHLQ